MRFIAKSPSAARPSRQGAGCAGVPYPVARIPQKWAPVLRKENAQFNEFEHFLAANRMPLCRKMLGARIWRSYTAKAAACHPSVVFFGGFWPLVLARRSGRRALDRASASALRQA